MISLEHKCFVKMGGPMTTGIKEMNGMILDSTLTTRKKK